MDKMNQAEKTILADGQYQLSLDGSYKFPEVKFVMKHDCASYGDKLKLGTRVSLAIPNMVISGPIVRFDKNSLYVFAESYVFAPMPEPDGRNKL